jgi:hypothetical protein
MRKLCQESRVDPEFKVGGKPGRAAIAAAEEIFGKDNIIIANKSANGNAPGETGFHSEQRGGLRAGENVDGSIQWSSHYACDGCAAYQNRNNIENPTGVASDNGGKVTRSREPGKPLESKQLAVEESI